MADRVCGTGDWNGPKPGDPDTSHLLLTATPAFGGIDVNWTFPLVNPHAVAYTMIFRGISANYADANLLINATGNFFYDRIDEPIDGYYYYWIQVVSVNGTVGELIGPAWSKARPLIDQVIQDLTGQIDSGLLAQSLKQSIDQIELNKLGITQEMLDRDAADDTLGVMINEIRGDLNGNTALLQQEVLARVTADEAFVGAVNTLYATFNGSIAAIQQQQIVQANAIQANANQINTVQVKLGNDISSVQVNMQAQINNTNGAVNQIGALWTARVDVNGLIGGFGVYNNGNFVEAGFDVDRFWIGRTNSKKKPFIVEGNEVFIDQAVINQLTFDKIRAYDGTFIFADGKLSANYIKVNEIRIYEANIENASIGTLKIQGNAVTVPVFTQAFDETSPTSYTTVLAVAVYMDQPGWLYASSSGTIYYGNGWVPTQTQLLVDGQVVSAGGGAESWVSAAHSGAAWVGAGVRVVTLQFQSVTGLSRIASRSLFAMAVKR